jgi:hypothetical protein
MGIIKGFFWAALAVALVLLAPASALGNHSATDVVSVSATAGNGASGAVYRASSDDGTRVFFQTNEQLVSEDTDAAIDIYERANGATTLLTTGPTGGNGANSATFAGASRDGTRVIFRTTEKLVAGDTDSVQDLYERAGGVTTQVSTGPTDGNGSSPGVFSGISRDGTHVFFQTAEPLVAGDTDTYIDVYDRSGGTTTRVSTGALGGNGPFAAMFDGATPDGSHVYFHTDEAIESSDFDERMDVYQRTGGATTHLSIGPAGGNGNLDFDYDAFFDGASADGSKVWLDTDEALVFGDTDTAFDVYERSGGTIGLLSTGPAGGNGAFGAFFDAASEDGARVFFDTQEPMAAGDSDASYDIYQRSGGATTVMSTGPGGGNGTFFSSFSGITEDGSRLYFSTLEQLVAADTDAAQDVYERSGGSTTLRSTGPDGGNGLENTASFLGASRDGTRVFFSTDESLIATDVDLFPDIYERNAGQTTRMSAGPIGGTGDFFVTWAGLAADGSRVFFETSEPLTSLDIDASNDVYQSSVAISGYPRPKSATQLSASLVPAFQPCAAPNRVHAATLSYGSCNPPAQTSSQLTMGSPDANGRAANGVGSVRLTALNGIAGTTADEADVKYNVTLTDVRRKSDLTDYTGQLQVSQSLRVTDKLSGSVPIDSATMLDTPFNVTVPCAATADTAIGSTCAITTTADTVLPGTVIEIKRTIWQLGQTQVYDGGADGLAATPGNTLFAVQGVFVP